jgi:hypothetical protein
VVPIRSPGKGGILLNKIQYEACITPLEARELTKGGRRNVIEYVMRVLAVGEVGRIYAETELVNFGTLGVRYVEAKFPVKPHI